MASTRRFRKMAGTVGIPAVLGLSTLAFVGLRGNAGQQSTTPPITPTAQVLDMQTAFEQVAQKLRPSVVYIRSRQTITSNRGIGGVGQDQQDASPFDFPGVPQGGNGRQFRMIPPQAQTRRAEASGSGVIVRGDGYILTNDHVVKGADKVTVTLQDGRQFVGKVKEDDKSDLALIKIEAENLPAAEFVPNSDNVKVGQWAIAFGSPFGLSDTMTVGIVSSVKRREEIGGLTGRLYPSLIQTDASINPGNSGGPLVDVYGRIVGINVAIESPTGSNAGIGFAIPGNQVRYVMDQLISKGIVTRGYLGFVPTTLDYDAQQRYGVKQGALVQLVQEGKPAAQAGLQVEDVIVRYNDQPVADEATLREMVARTAPGAKATLVVRRDGGEKTLTATIGSAPAPKVIDAPAEAPVKTRPTGKLGVGIVDAGDPQVRAKYKLGDTIRGGAMIDTVVPGSPAFEAGLQPGDVIVRLGGKTVANATQLSDIASGLKAGNVAAVIRRGGPDGVQTILVQIVLE